MNIPKSLNDRSHLIEDYFSQASGVGREEVTQQGIEPRSLQIQQQRFNHMAAGPRVRN